MDESLSRRHKKSVRERVAEKVTKVEKGFSLRSPSSTKLLKKHVFQRKKWDILFYNVHNNQRLLLLVQNNKFGNCRIESLYNCKEYLELQKEHN